MKFIFRVSQCILMIVVSGEIKAAEFEGLGFLKDRYNYDIPSAAFSQAWGISDDGEVIAGVSINPHEKHNNHCDVEVSYEAFRWSKETGMQGLGDLEDAKELRCFYSVANGISGDGKVIIGASISKKSIISPFLWGYEAFAWDESSQRMRGLGVGESSQLPLSIARAASYTGDFIFGDVMSNFPRAFLLNRASEQAWITPIGSAPSSQDVVSAVHINSPQYGLTISGNSKMAFGSAVGVNGCYKPYVVNTEESSEFFGHSKFIDEDCGLVKASSHDGNVIVGAVRRGDGSNTAVAWYRRGSSWSNYSWVRRDMDQFAEFANSFATDFAFVQGELRAVGFVHPDPFSQYREGFIFDGRNNEMIILKDYLISKGASNSTNRLENWRVSYPSGISKNGRVIIGTGVDADGKEQAFRASLY